jgi:UDP-N-acetylmuramyl tripeptide synthase
MIGCKSKIGQVCKNLREKGVRDERLDKVRVVAVRLTGISANLALDKREIIGIYGAGGKTTLLYRLAQELAEAQKPVLVTTTTKIYRPDQLHAVVSRDFSEAREMLRSCFSDSPGLCRTGGRQCPPAS